MLIDIEDQSAVIILGSHKFFNLTEKSRQRFVTKNFWMHENFSTKTIENDIAIVELPIAAEINKFVKIIKISTEERVEDSNAIFNGWGYYDSQGLTANTLQAAKMKILQFKDCLKFKDNYYEKLTEKNICALGRKKRIAKICNGDS